jgi:osmotically-inducible protein OsmY
MKIGTQTMIFGLALCAFSGYGMAATPNAGAQALADAARSMPGSAKQASLNVSDQELDKRVEAALERAPYLYAQHITVTSRDGIVTLGGMVENPSDLRDALKISGRVDGVKDLVDDLEIWDFGGRSR